MIPTTDKTPEKDNKINTTALVREFLTITDHYFTITDCLQFISGRDNHYKSVQTLQSLRNSITVCLKRMKDAGEIQPGKSHGIYRVIDTKLNRIDLEASEDLPLPVQFPFGIQEYVNIFAKSIILISSAPNQGKTAFALNFALQNCEDFDVDYYSSEMGPAELKNRLSKFTVPKEVIRRVNWYERASAFGDCINPNHVSCIDFLEIHTDFYRIAEFLREIYDKLDKGIALICVQANPGQLPVGGYRGMEKPRLVVQLDNHKMKLIKAKNWATELNPNGLWRTFKLVQGCHFIDGDDKGWQREGGDNGRVR